MQVLCYDLVHSTQTRVEIIGSMIRIGRSPDCDIVLDNPSISDVTMIMQKNGDAWEIQSCGINEIDIGGVPLTREKPFLLQYSERIRIKPAYEIVLAIPTREEVTQRDKLGRLNSELIEFANKVHLDILERMRLDFQSINSEKIDDAKLIAVEKDIEDIAKKHGIFDKKKQPLSDFLAGQCVRDEVLHHISKANKSTTVGILQKGNHYGRLLTASPASEDELMMTAGTMETRLRLTSETPLDERLRIVEENFWDHWDEIVATKKISADFKNYLVLRFLKKTLKDILYGYGPLEDLLRLPLITEIMVVNFETIFVEKSGRIENSGRRFFSDAVTQTIISRIVAKVNRHIDKSQPLVDARLSDGSRVNAIIDPIAVNGSCLTIRRFPETRMTMDNLVNIQSVSRPAAEFLRASILARKNIIVSGGTGTGKTTLLNCMCDDIPNNERIVTIEDTAELQIKKEHVVRLETKEANIEGKGAYTIRDLVKNSLRMRPDRIIVGECRGAEALDMLQAMNTGHDGSLTTIHANSASDALLRLEVLVQMAADIPMTSIRRQIVSAIDLIVQLRRLRNGRRCVTQISEVAHLDPVTGEILLRNIFFLDNEIDDCAPLVPTGSLPSYMPMLIERNMISLNHFYF